MTIQHNIEAMNTYRQMNITGGNLTKSARNLSSGYKINIAADDAAGLSISEKMRKQIRGLTQASVNSEDGISMVQVADGALSEVHDMLDRCIELSIQAANGTLSDSDRVKIQDEIDEIVKEIDGIKERTKFNEVYVLKGNAVYRPGMEKTEITNYGSLPLWVTSPSTASIPAGQKGTLSEEYKKEYNYTKTTWDTTTTSTPSGITVTTTTTVSTGSKIVSHPAASLDFSAIDNGTGNVSDLIGMGFNTTCCTCNKYYSVEFTRGTGLVSSEHTGNTYVYKVGIDGINSSSDLIDAIIDVVSENPGNHYTWLAKDGAKLWIYDNRAKESQPQDIYDKMVQGEHEYKVEWDKDFADGYGGWNNRPYPALGLGVFGTGVMGKYTTYTDGEWFRVHEQLALQVGSDAGNLMHVRLATISSQALGIDKINVRGFIYEEVEEEDEYGNKYRVMVKRLSGADDAIRKFSAAKDMVSVDRSRLGAYQNRLEHTVNNLDNVVENTTAAESQIRDTDMAKEMVRYSNANIMMQAGQSMLSQANQSRQGILSLLAA